MGQQDRVTEASLAGPAQLEITVEFYGIPRTRAGRASLLLQGTSLSTVLATIRELCPGLADLVGPDGRIGRHYLLSLNGQAFVGSEDQLLRAGDRVVVLSADAGG